MSDCDCIKNFEEKLTEKFKDEKFRKPFESLKLDTIFTMPDFKQITYTSVIITLKGQKKKEEKSLSHNYCPFCGKKYS